MIGDRVQAEGAARIALAGGDQEEKWERRPGASAGRAPGASLTMATMLSSRPPRIG
jgi:hypothetical protein